MKISEIATLRTNIAIALYALAHIQNRFTSGDTENLEEALEKSRDIVDAWLKALPHELEVKDAVDK